VATVCLCVKTIHHPSAGGHLWAYLNWAFGLRAAGHTVIWAEEYDAGYTVELLQPCVAWIKDRLAPFGFAERLALIPQTATQPELAHALGCMDAAEAVRADLFLNFAYKIEQGVVDRFRRTALVDIDPGLTQLWWKHGYIKIARYQRYYTIGETVGQPGARFPDCGVTWHYTPPAVSLEAWPVTPAPAGAPFTTVTHWGGEWVEDENGVYPNDKRTGFLPYFDLPQKTRAKLELALFLAPSEAAERTDLERRGWSIRNSVDATGTPQAYRSYIQGSAGEFSCVKPSCIRLQNAWISDRTICYLASGKPAVVQHTGPSRFLPDAEGLLRFRDIDEAARMLEDATSNYERHARAARALAERYFDAKRPAEIVVEGALA
jgi:hypothetical protein